ncbi:hypothetical protein AB6A40_011577 [Gnathostoma spinigerum]|uniref:Uncharacterized protein n=1 Tax=Gnathostoma spinigerum TaxID=75299 RepID=A0ABD6F3S0_9BILA
MERMKLVTVDMDDGKRSLLSKDLYLPVIYAIIFITRRPVVEHSTLRNPFKINCYTIQYDNIYEFGFLLCDEAIVFGKISVRWV